jgi:hypothetical protein
MPTLDAGLQKIVDKVRYMSSAPTTDVFEGVTYWTDQQIESLALSASSFVRVVARQGRLDGSLYLIRAPYTHWFSTTGLTLYAEDSKTPMTESYTYVPENGFLTFSPALSNVKWLEVEGTIVDYYMVLENLWDTRAQQRVSYVNFKSGSTSVTMSQEYANCVQMRDYYRNQRLSAVPRR